MAECSSPERAGGTAGAAPTGPVLPVLGSPGWAALQVGSQRSRGPGSLPCPAAHSAGHAAQDANAHCWLMSNLPSTSTPTASAGLLLTHLCLTRVTQTQVHLALLDSMTFMSFMRVSLLFPGSVGTQRQRSACAVKGPAVLSGVYKQAGSQHFEGDSYSRLGSICETFLGCCVQPWAPLDDKLIGVWSASCCSEARTV